MKTFMFALAASVLAATAAVAEPAAPVAQTVTAGYAARKGATMHVRQTREIQTPAGSNRATDASSFNWDGDQNNG